MRASQWIDNDGIGSEIKWVLPGNSLSWYYYKAVTFFPPLDFNWNYPVMYQNDGFNLAQTYSPMTSDPNPVGGVATKPGNIHRWVFSDGEPIPVGYAQLVLKGLSEFDYESIDWAKDWRCRNWIQSPPFYFGNSLYMSEDETTAHTQRLDNPYVMTLGPMSSAEMPKVVGQLEREPSLARDPTRLRKSPPRQHLNCQRHRLRAWRAFQA